MRQPHLLLFLLVGCNDDQPIKLDPISFPEGSEEEVGDVGSWLSMAPTADGKPAIAYYDRTYDALGFAVGTISSGAITWSREKVDSYPDEAGYNPGDAGKYTSLAIAADGTVWITYQDVSNGSVKYAKKSGDTWEVNIADSGDGPDYDGGYWVSMALDPSGNPVFVHYDQGKSYLTVGRWNGTGFTADTNIEGTDYTADTGGTTVSANVGEYAKIYIDTDGREYIAYYDRAWGALRLAVGGSSGYEIQTVDDDGDVGQWPDLVVDNGTVYLAYLDVTNQHLKYAVGSGGSFTTSTVDTSPYSGADTEIFLRDGNPTIIYFDGFNNDMKRATYNGSAWSTSTVGGSDGALGYHNEAVNAGGAYYAACYDYTHRNIWFAALD